MRRSRAASIARGPDRGAKVPVERAASAIESSSEGETRQSFCPSNQRLRRVGETSGAFARLLLPEKLLIHTERWEMRRDLCVLAGICVLLAAPAGMSQSDPQRPGESPSQQTTV